MLLEMNIGMVAAHKGGVVLGRNSPFDREDFPHEDFILHDLDLSGFLQLFEVIDFKQLKVVDELLFDHGLPESVNRLPIK